jgi:2-aminoadipate transaminase
LDWWRDQQTQLTHWYTWMALSKIAPQLDELSTTPLYQQLSAYFRELIASGHLSPGEKLPTTRELAGQIGLNRATVLAAYQVLEESGLISGQVGRGSFVKPAPQRLDWSARLPAAQPRGASSARPGALSFESSRPSEDLFPLEDFRRSCEEVLRDPGFGSILQLGSPSGHEPLRQHLLREAADSKELAAGDDILVTNGCQQALDLIARVLVRPGDSIAVEDPVYPGLKNLLAASGARLAGIPVGTRGIDLDALAAVLAREKPRLIVVTPNFQNPTGATMPLQARERLLALARAAGTIVIENDPYRELRYSGEPLPSLKRLDDSGAVLLLRSFSKVSFPGLRVGWILGARPPVARIMEAKQLADLHSDQLSQAVLLRFAQSGRLTAHVERIRGAGRTRLRALLSACARWMPAGARWTEPEGGMNVWLKLPRPLDTAELVERAGRENVAYLPGKFCAVEDRDPGTLRLSFAALSAPDISRGVEILGKIFASELERAEVQTSFLPERALV